MNRYVLVILLALSSMASAFGQRYKISGKVVNTRNEAVELATIVLPGNQLWSITDEAGAFTLEPVQKGISVLTIHCLGYAKKTLELDVQRNITDLIITLQEDNLALDEVVVTARKIAGEQTTSYLMDRRTLDHAQVLNVTDVTGLLPGGKTRRDNHLATTNDERFAIRSGRSETGNPSFGTAIEIDGIRLDNNSSMSDGLLKTGTTSLTETKGISTKNISTVNIESIEVITGIPSVEYGDLSNGVVKINTRKGKTPYHVEFSTEPQTKQYAISKGFLLGAKAGVLNSSFEHAKSNSDLASPHTTYARNAFSLTYSNAFNQAKKNPITLSAGISGNIGGYNSKSDPDSFQDNYEKNRDNTIRGNFTLNWLLNRSWITNLEFSGSLSYSDKQKKINANKNSASPQPVLHGMEEGYFLTTNYEDDPNAPIVQGPTGYWYELKTIDSKPINYALKAKADWMRKFGGISNKILIGAEFKRSGNEGKGLYFEDMKFAPTWREYRYDNLPYINNFALYAEDRLTIPVSSVSTLQLTAGLRSDITNITHSEYGTVGSISPRLKAKYTFWEKSDKVVKSLAIHAGWGKAVKLPSFEVLYPLPKYIDQQVFGTSVKQDNTNTDDKIYGYNITPIKEQFNPNLKWQYNRQAELGIETNIAGIDITLSAFHNTTVNPYISSNVYLPYTYNLTKENALDASPIPHSNRVFSIDRITGIVTVSDKSGALPSQQLDYVERNSFKSNTTYTNGSDVKRSGVEWVVNFPQIPALRTSFRLDGNYYYYKGVEENLYAYKAPDLMNDGTPYRYIGYYSGASGNSQAGMVRNGSLSKELNTNLTVTTHIPKIRLIISMKIEGALYNYSRSLSEYNGKTRGFVWDEETMDYFGTNTDIYGGDRYVAVYPLYYSTWENPDVKVPFAESFIDAKDNNPELYGELLKLVMKSNYKTTFNPEKLSSYFSANLSITKEIGDFATISFFANNFYNSMGKVKSGKEGTQHSLYNNYIPRFYYGLSLRLKI